MTKTIYPDDLRKGKWVIVAELKKTELTYSQELMELVPNQFHSNGIPVKIHAVSLPFVAGYPATDPTQLVTIDTTRFVLREPNKGYVEVFINDYQANRCVHDSRGVIIQRG